MKVFQGFKIVKRPIIRDLTINDFVEAITECPPLPESEFKQEIIWEDVE